MTHYRLATVADLDACQAFEWTRSREDLAWHIAGELLFVAEHDGRLVGYARLESFWKAMPYLALIQVAPEMRGTGIGSALLRFIRGDLAARGYRWLLSSTTSGEDGPARWHQRNGFVHVGTLAELNDGGGEEFWRLPLQSEAADPA